MRASFVGGLAPAAVMLLSAGAFAQDTRIINGMVAEGGHTLRGVVIVDGEPRSNMTVVFTLACDTAVTGRREGCGRQREYVTDADGGFSVGALQRGAYDIDVRPCPGLDAPLPPVNVGSDLVQEFPIIIDRCAPRDPVSPGPWISGNESWAR